VVKTLTSSAKALPKNLIHPISMQDPKGVEFRRPILPFAGARRRSGWRRLRWRRNNEKRKKSYVLVCSWWRPMSHIYREVKPTSRRDRDLNRLCLGFRLPCLTELGTKSPKIKTAKGSRTHARHIPARRGARAWCLSSLLHHIAWRSGDNLHIYVGHPTPPLARWD
jgi:hypothetical protein